MGTVYLATDERAFERDVVIKIPLDSLQNHQFLERFKLECQQLIKLVHPHIVQVLDVGAVDGLPFLVMQYLSGGNLSHKFKNNYQLHHVEVIEWFVAIAKALDFIHKKKIIHRDVKPSNILFDDEGHAFLADFGIAKVLQVPSLTLTGELPGTLDYVPPEAALQQPPGAAYDQYALATVVYKALSGELPYQGDSALARFTQKLTKPPRPLNSVALGVADNGVRAIMKALSINPKERFTSCTEFANEFKQGLALQTKKPRPSRAEFLPQQLETDHTIKLGSGSLSKFKKILYSGIVFAPLLLIILVTWIERVDLDDISVAQNANHKISQTRLNEIKDPKRTEPNLSTELINAAQAGSYETLERLLQNGVDPNVRNEDGANALIAAAGHGNTDIVKTLLATGADPQARVWDKTALMIAEQNRDSEIIDVFNLRLGNTNAWALEKAKILKRLNDLKTKL
jgi:serine/threonine protein kinase